MGSRILLNFFVIVASVFIASANGAGVYKLLAFSEEFPHPWQKVVHRTWTPRIQKRQDFNFSDPEFAPSFTNRFEFDINSTDAPEIKRKYGFEETNEINKFRDDAVVNAIYSRMPMPVILVSSYPKSQN